MKTPYAAQECVLRVAEKSRLGYKIKLKIRINILEKYYYE